MHRGQSVYMYLSSILCRSTLQHHQDDQCCARKLHISHIFRKKKAKAPKMQVVVQIGHFVAFRRNM